MEIFPERRISQWLFFEASILATDASKILAILVATGFSNATATSCALNSMRTLSKGVKLLWFNRKYPPEKN